MRKRNSKKKSSSSMYRSGLEKEFAENFAGLGFEYEPYSVKYTMHRLYKPDFVIGNYLIECKGFFRVGDTQKYKAIRDSINNELIFVLSDPNKKVRKGSKLSMGQWCDKEGFRYFTVKQVKEIMEYIEDDTGTG